MYQAAIENIKNSIFPIFFESIQGNTKKIGVTGTGFFIDDQGHFLTALHVVTGIPDNASIHFRGNIPNSVTNPAIVLTEVYRDPIRDIFLGKINNAGQPAVNYSLTKPKIGKSVCLSGYPLAKLTYNPDNSLNISAVRQYWQPTFIIDEITFVKNEINYIGFMTQDTSLNGMSGGPVFDKDGIVFGVNTAFSTREIQQKNKPSIKVFNGLALGNTYITDVYGMINENE